MLVADLNAVERAHLAHAVDLHLRWCSTNAITVPPIVRALRAALSARSGQERTEFAGGLADGDEWGRFLLTLDQVARRLGMASRSVRRLVESGELPSLKIGGARRIDPVDLDQFVETRKGVRSAG